MGWLVTWDGPHTDRRASKNWPQRENAQTHYERKAKAGLRPELHPPEDAVDDLLAQRSLESQP